MPKQPPEVPDEPVDPVDRDDSRQPLGRRRFLVTGLGSALLAPVSCALRLGDNTPPASCQTVPREQLVPASRGVSLAGAEFGTDAPGFSNRDPGRLGRDYTYNSRECVESLAAEGFQTFRLPIRWERLQPDLGKRLDQREVDAIHGVVSWVGGVGGQLVIDLHNYGRYRTEVAGRVRDVIVDESIDGRRIISAEHLSDLWCRVAEEFRDSSAVVGYGLMNEPHNMGGSDWRRISQRVVEAIRSVDRTTVVYVAGDDWSSSERWVAANGDAPWVDDPSNQVVYEAHCYFDRDATGKYHRPIREERRLDLNFNRRAAMRVRPFVDWCQRHGVAGFVGEFGTPADEPGWGPLAHGLVRELDSNGVGWCCWAGGEWWGDYRLSVQPRDGRSAPQLRDIL